MQQDIYFPKRTSLDAMTSTYDISSALLFAGVIIFWVILCIAIWSLIRLVIYIRRTTREQRSLSVEMQQFYKKQLEILHGRPFMVSFYQYSKLLVELHKSKNLHALWQTLWYDDELIQYIEKAVSGANELDYEQEKRIKDSLHQPETWF